MPAITNEYKEATTRTRNNNQMAIQTKKPAKYRIKIKNKKPHTAAPKAPTTKIVGPALTTSAMYDVNSAVAELICLAIKSSLLGSSLVV